MYDKTTHARVVADNYFWIGMTEDQLWDNVCRVWDKPQNCAVSHIKAGIAQLESRGILTSEEAAACLKQTLKTRAKAKREEVTA
jgi:crotonobetainyl-CoA:carnitine CoA-transferase CaiB-like acyl-CoA transferase